MGWKKKYIYTHTPLFCPLFLSFFFYFLPFPIILNHRHPPTPYPAKTQKMELFIPSMACMSAALGSTSQRDRLTAVAVRGCVDVTTH